MALKAPPLFYESMNCDTEVGYRQPQALLGNTQLEHRQQKDVKNMDERMKTYIPELAGNRARKTLALLQFCGSIISTLLSTACAFCLLKPSRTRGSFTIIIKHKAVKTVSTTTTK